eukprot:scaffold7267_cov72-Phaeocystis_antarctica.AAC.6
MPTTHRAIVGPPSGPKLRQPYHAPKNAPVVAYHCGHIVRRKPTPNPSGPPARAKQNFEEHWNEHKWERGRGLALAQRLEQTAESAGSATARHRHPGWHGWLLEPNRRVRHGHQPRPKLRLLRLEMPSREAATPCIEGCNPVPQQAADACRLRPHGLRVGGAWLLEPSRQARC